MYISTKNKTAFFAAPRTASNSVQYVLENCGINDPNDIVFNMDTVLHNNDFYSELNNPNSNFISGLNSFHTNISQAVESEYITEDQLREFDNFGFVKHPYARWVSRLFLAKHMKLWDHPDPKEFLIGLCRTQNFEPNVSHVSVKFKWNIRDYFYYNDELVVTPYKIENLNSVLTKKIEGFGGLMPPIPYIEYGGKTPPEFKEPIETWLPQDCINLLTEYYEDDIMFYNSI